MARVATERADAQTLGEVGHDQASIASSSAAPALTLDYTQWVGKGATESSRGAFVDQLREACAGLGFFYLRGTPLDQGDLRQRIFDLNKAFFALPLQVRQRISIVNSPHFRGFSKFGDERTQSLVDHRDQIDYGLEMEKPQLSDPTSLQRFPFLNLIGPNQFLSDDVLPGHRQLVLRWLELCQEVARSLTEALEAALGAAPNELVQYLTGTSVQRTSAEHRNNPGEPARLYARMKTIRYPRAESIDGVSRLQDSTQGVGAHKDGGWITILATSPHKGLQVQSLAGEWLDVVHHPSAMVVNFGQQIERVSRGAINAATHRVLSHKQTSQSDGHEGDRYSVAYFSMPALNVVVTPLPQSSLSPQIVKAWQRAQAERQKATGSHDVVTVVPKGDLWGADDAPFGFQAWRGIVRSHREWRRRANLLTPY